MLSQCIGVGFEIKLILPVAGRDLFVKFFEDLVLFAARKSA